MQKKPPARIEEGLKNGASEEVACGCATPLRGAYSAGHLRSCVATSNSLLEFKPLRTCFQSINTQERPPAIPEAFQKWSERRGSNSRHLPWQGSALPTELRSLKKSWIKSYSAECLSMRFLIKQAFAATLGNSSRSRAGCAPYRAVQISYFYSRPRRQPRPAMSAGPA